MMQAKTLTAQNIIPRIPVSKVEWWEPLIKVIPTLLLFFGTVPGIIANRKGIPNWKSYFWRGLIFGLLFFPLTLVLLYQVLKYKSPTTMSQAQVWPKALPPLPPVSLQ